MDYVEKAVANNFSKAILKQQYKEKGVDVDHNGIVRKLKVIYNATGKSEQQMNDIIVLEVKQFMQENPHFDFRAPAKCDDGPHGSVKAIMEFIFNPNKAI